MSHPLVQFYLGHVRVENRNVLIAAAMATQANGYAEREAALGMLAAWQHGRFGRITVGADQAYDAKNFVTAVRKLKVTAHVTGNNKGRRSNKYIFWTNLELGKKQIPNQTARIMRISTSS